MKRFHLVIPALNGLKEESNSSCWVNVCLTNDRQEPSVLLPLLLTCFHFLFEDDGVVSRTSFKALPSSD